MNTVSFSHKNVRVVAHRGLSGIETENTCASFIAAGNRSYWGVETDVRCTADGNFVILHDETAERISGMAIKPEESTLEELRRIRLYERGTTEKREYLYLPTLEEYIRICQKYEKICVLELKTEMDEATTKRMIDRISALGYLDRVVFISFHWNDLVHVRRLCPDQKIQFLFDERFLNEGNAIERLREYRFDVDVHHLALTKEWVDKFHEAGIEINCWTVDSPTDAERYADWGVDYITTNILE